MMPNFAENSTDSSRLRSSKPSIALQPSLNVMEVLVAEEVAEQFARLPHKLARQINPSEVAAFALNRLPALYATTKRGWDRQWKRGTSELRAQVVAAVHQGIIAVQRDPFQTDSLLTVENPAETALEELKQLLQCEHLSWQNLSSVVRLTLMDTMRGKITWAAPKSNKSFDWNSHPHHQKI